MITSISFNFINSPETNDHQVRCEFDGTDMLNNIDDSMLGIDPPEFFSQSELLDGGELLIGRCGCGISACGSAMVKVVVSERTVTWTLPSNLVVEYERNDYESVVNIATNNFDWENTERTAERLVGDLDFSEMANKGYEFRWASGRISKEHINLSFFYRGEQSLIQLGWDHKDAAEARLIVESWLAEYA